MKKGVTLVELLVVIAIIAVLAAVLLGTFSGGTESARAAKCLSNMRNLSAACQSYGVASGHYPSAGSFEMVDIEYGGNGEVRREYMENHGWVSWNSGGAYAKDSNGYYPKSHVASAAWNISTYNQDEETRRYCLTNGVLWQYVSGNREVYVCPLHAKKVDGTPLWSYVMNAYFKWDHTKGKRAMPSDDEGIHRWYGKLQRADRRLLFAEMPFDSSCAGVPVHVEASGELCDSVLQYKDCLGCGEAECIGFNHLIGKRTRYGHVCFADGHCEKMAYPKGGMSEQEVKELTQWLCEGKDISFNGTRYERITTTVDN